MIVIDDIKFTIDSLLKWEFIIHLLFALILESKVIIEVIRMILSAEIVIVWIY